MLWRQATWPCTQRTGAFAVAGWQQHWEVPCCSRREHDRNDGSVGDEKPLSSLCLANHLQEPLQFILNLSLCASSLIRGGGRRSGGWGLAAVASLAGEAWEKVGRRLAVVGEGWAGNREGQTTALSLYLRTNNNVFLVLAASPLCLSSPSPTGMASSNSLSEKEK